MANPYDMACAGAVAAYEGDQGSYAVVRERPDRTTTELCRADNLPIVYRALKGELVYRDPGADAYDIQQRRRVLRQLRQRAATLGFELVNRETGEVLEPAIS